jgi:hypothetical protein
MDKYLSNIKNITMDLEADAIDCNETFRIGSLIFIKITNLPLHFQLNGNELVKNENTKDFINILKDKLIYYTSYLFEYGFSLYSVKPEIEGRYLPYEFLAMRIGKFNTQAYNKFSSQVVF